MNLFRNRHMTLPPFSFRALSYALALIVAPNVIFLLLAWLTHTARPLLNLDYFAAVLLLALPKRWMRLLGIVMFWLAVLFDVLMFVMQLFPFMDLQGALYLLPFVLKAPWSYRLLCALALAYIIVMPFCLWRLGKKTNPSYALGLCLLLGAASYFTGHLQYYQRGPQSDLFGRNNFFYGKSQLNLYGNNKDFFWMLAHDVNPVFSPLQFDHASRHLVQPQSAKILFIVNESWGQPKNPALQDAVLAKLAAERDRFDIWQVGHFPFVGATVQGEIRELCVLQVQGLALRRTPAGRFADCLPNRLRQQGYMTIAQHGASSLLYDRSSWYPKAGFAQVVAAEQLMGKPTCQAFNGVCDSALFAVVKEAFAHHPKLFFYWMTLTSHTDYPAEDLFNHRLDCAAYGLPTDTMLCRNFGLQTQFFDELAELVRQPEMRGVEVIVVGDHPPPVINLGEMFKYLTEPGEVAWVHFKVKE